MTTMNSLDILRSYRTPEMGLNVLWELFDCGVQIEIGPDGIQYELRLYKDLYINKEVVPTEDVKERLDFIFQGAGSQVHQIEG